MIVITINPMPLHTDTDIMNIAAEIIVDLVIQRRLCAFQVNPLSKRIWIQ